MLTPSAAPKLFNFYAVGNTPAVSLTSCLPQGSDANILLLGCGDIRNILFTAYSENGFPSRKLDFTCCDIVEEIHVRNIVAYTFLLDEVSGKQLDALWDIYYHLYLDDDCITLLCEQIERLVDFSKTWDEWRGCVYGKQLEFCDQATFNDFQRLIRRFKSAAESKDEPSYRNEYRSRLSECAKIGERAAGKGVNLTALRSAAPLTLSTGDELPKAFQHYWDNGTTSKTTAAKRYPNPMFSPSMSPHLTLHYATNPLLGFYLAIAYGAFTKASPLRLSDKTAELFKATKAAKVQFSAWAKAFQSIKDRIVLRFTAADALVFCHTLQDRLSSRGARTSAHWFRRLFDTRHMELDEVEYGRRGDVKDSVAVPLKFDVVDTSNLSDDFGALNILVAASPLLANKPSSTLYTELLVHSEATDTDIFAKLSYGDGRTVSLLLGLIAAEQTTNATASSILHEFFLQRLNRDQAPQGARQMRNRVSWKLSHLFSGQARFQTPLQIDASELAAIFFAVYKEIGGRVAANQFHNLFSDVHLAFGHANAKGPRDSDGFTLEIEEDEDGWAGNSPLLASCYVPTCALQVEPKSAKIELCVKPAGQSITIFGSLLGEDLCVYRTTLGDESRVFITKYLPGHDGYPIVCPLLTHFSQRGQKKSEGEKVILSANVDKSTGRIATLTGHIDIQSKKGKALLEKNTPTALRQASPSIIDVVFGDDQLVYPMAFPVPVSKDEARIRIARKSSYIEVIAPFSNPADAPELADFMFPSTLDLHHLPVILSIPHLNLDSLPIFDISNKASLNSWLATHVSLIFSTRERRIRQDPAAKLASGIHKNLRINFKESLGNIFMLATGLQGDQMNVFSIGHPDKGGIHMLLFISSMRLDGANASVVADAAVIPLMPEMLDDESDLRPFLARLQEFKMCGLIVDDAELVLWKKIVPAFVERCRNWSHGEGCEYKKEGATIPLGIGDGEMCICSCGMGKLPKDFIALPEWNSAAKYATRLALSPVYVVPSVEEVVDMSGSDAQPTPARGNARPGPAQVSTSRGEAEEAQKLLEKMFGKMNVNGCQACGKKEGTSGGELKKYGRCHKVKYCSAECQKADWKAHRVACQGHA